MQQPQPFNPYAAPQAPQAYAPPGYGGALQLRADGTKLVFAKETYLPNACVKCGAQQQVGRRRKQYVFIPWYGRMFGLLGYWLTKKTATVDLPICPTCDATFKQARLVMWLTTLAPLLGGFALMLVGSALDVDALTGLGVIALFGSLVVGLVVYLAYGLKRMMPMAVKIDDREITLARVSPQAIQFYVWFATNGQAPPYGVPQAGPPRPYP